MRAANYTRELESIAQNARLFSGKLDEVFAELGQKLTNCLEVERVNLWMFNDQEERIECIGNFTKTSNEFSKGDQLSMHDIPGYYAHLKSNKILAIDDVHQSDITQEICSIYCDVHGITSMLDLPIRMQGGLKGVMCYEHTGKPRKWTEEEIQFTLAANQIITLALETANRRRIEKELIQVLREKELLMKEMNHRIKNNLSVLMSLLRMQGRESGDPRVQSVLSDCETRIFSMAKIHEQLYQSEDYLEVDLHSYIAQLVEEFRNSSLSNNDRVAVFCDLDPVKMETSRAINLGLIVMEILNNIMKHAFKKQYSSENRVDVELKKSKDSLIFQISDNGIGFSPENRSEHSLGMTLIEDLSEQIDATLEINSSDSGSTFKMIFPQ